MESIKSSVYRVSKVGLRTKPIEQILAVQIYNFSIGHPFLKGQYDKTFAPGISRQTTSSGTTLEEPLNNFMFAISFKLINNHQKNCLIVSLIISQ